MRRPPHPRPPDPELSAEWRRRFAEEARCERPDLSTLCLLMGAVADGALDEDGIDAAQMELDDLAGRLPYAPGGPRDAQLTSPVRESGVSWGWCRSRRPGCRCS